jgi:hypothetical protein
MATILVFPRQNRNDKPPAKAPGVRMVSVMVSAIWTLTVMFWPILRWVLALDVTAHLFRVLIAFADKGAYFDWTLATHFLVFTALMYFVGCYRP